ncbi:MAG: Fur family transcriptional regulator [Pseudonocardiaceae bacterium]
MDRAFVTPTPLDGHALTQLRSHGLRCTPGRIAILQVLLTCAPGHVTVDEIHQRVIALGWPTDNTAVRRTLHVFTSAGLTHTLAVPGPVAYGLAKPPHHHVLCSTCGALTDVPAAALTATLTTAQAATGYQLTRSGLTLPGRCPGCQESPPAARH